MQITERALTVLMSENQMSTFLGCSCNDIQLHKMHSSGQR